MYGCVITHLTCPVEDGLYLVLVGPLALGGAGAVGAGSGGGPGARLLAVSLHNAAQVGGLVGDVLLGTRGGI